MCDFLFDASAELREVLGYSKPSEKAKAIKTGIKLYSSGTFGSQSDRIKHEIEFHYRDLNVVGIEVESGMYTSGPGTPCYAFLTLFIEDNI